MPMVKTSLPDLVAVLGVLINLQVADLHERLVLTRVDTGGGSSIRVLRANVKEAVLAPGSLGDIDGIFVAFLFLIWIIINACLRLVN